LNEEEVMIRTGEQYLESIRDGRQVYVNGEKVKDVPSHPMFKPLVDVRARIYDMAHDPKTAEVMTYQEDGETFAVGLKPPRSQQDWWEKRRATDAVFEDINGVVTRVGDETVGEMWSLFDGQDVLNEVDPQFSQNIRRHIDKVIKGDPFHVSANTDPKGDRSKPPQEQDPDMLLHVVKETDAGIVVRGAKYETAAAYANQAFTKPTIANWGSDARGLSAFQPLRRGRLPGDLRQRADPLGGRAVLPPHPGGDLHPRHPAPLLGLRLRAAEPEVRRHDDRDRALQRAPDRARQAAGGSGEAVPAGGLPRGH
jgi:hypothetical protein